MGDLYAHLAGGTTTVARAWAVVRRDGTVLGFTDHDRDLTFDGLNFRASSGVTAKALQQSTGLSVDNSEAVGALSNAALTEGDNLAGVYDGAEVSVWLVNWADVSARVLQFRGSIGEIERAGGAFRAELRGLTEALNQPQGTVYQKACSAVLGDVRCRFDLTTPGFFDERPAEQVTDRLLFEYVGFSGFADRWFEAGRMLVLTGAAAGLIGVIKNDRLTADGRMIELWQSIGADVAPGDLVRVEAGCDKRTDTCKFKFNNFLNYRGFPAIPGEDWLMSYPTRSTINDGGSLVR